MARSFDGSTAFLQTNTVPVAGPATFACWFWVASTSPGIGPLFGTGIRANATASCIELQTGAAGVLRAFQANNGTGAIATTTAVYQPGCWNHACAVFASATSRTIYLNGTNAVLNTGSLGFLSYDTTYLGARATNNIHQNFVNAITAHAAAWNVALNPSEVLQIGQGTNPLLVRSQSLQVYYPLNTAGVGTEYNRVPWRAGKDDLAVTVATPSGPDAPVFPIM